MTAFLVGLGASVVGLLTFAWKKKEAEVVKANHRAQDAEAKPLEEKVSEAAQETLSAKERYEKDLAALRADTESIVAEQRSRSGKTPL